MVEGFPEMTAPTGHYDTLGIARNATAAEIKRAYFKLVRVHSPENDPDGFRRISEAYTVLSNTEARKAYDEDEPIPPELAARIDAAAAHCESAPQKAVSEAQKLLRAPDLPDSARFAVAVILMRAARPDLAVPVAAGLSERHPDESRYTLLHARALLDSEHAADAVTVLARFLTRNPGHVDVTLAITEAMAASGDVADQIPLLDSALAGSAGGTPAAIPLLIRKTVALLQCARPDEAAAVAASVVPIVGSDDDELRRHAALKWAELHEEAADAEMWDIARAAALASLALIEVPELRAVATNLAPHAAAMRELRTAALDTEIPKWIRSTIEMRLAVGVPPDAQQEFLLWLGSTSTSMPETIAADWQSFQRKYTQAAKLLESIREQALAACDNRAEERSGVGLAAKAVLASVLLATCVHLRGRTQESRPQPPHELPTFGAPSLSPKELDAVESYAHELVMQVPVLVRRMAETTDAEAGFTILQRHYLTSAPRRTIAAELAKIADDAVRADVEKRIDVMRTIESSRTQRPVGGASEER